MVGGCNDLNHASRPWTIIQSAIQSACYCGLYKQLVVEVYLNSRKAMPAATLPGECLFPTVRLRTRVLVLWNHDCSVSRTQQPGWCIRIDHLVAVQLSLLECKLNMSPCDYATSAFPLLQSNNPSTVLIIPNTCCFKTCILLPRHLWQEYDSRLEAKGLNLEIILKGVKGPWFSEIKRGTSNCYIYIKGVPIPKASARLCIWSVWPTSPLLVKPICWAL